MKKRTGMRVSEDNVDIKFKKQNAQEGKFLIEYTLTLF